MENQKEFKEKVYRVKKKIFDVLKSENVTAEEADCIFSDVSILIKKASRQIPISNYKQCMPEND